MVIGTKKSIKKRQFRECLHTGKFAEFEHHHYCHLCFVQIVAELATAAAKTETILKRTQAQYDRRRARFETAWLASGGTLAELTQ